MISTSRVHGIARLRATFSTNLRKAMHRKSMSQSDLARAIWNEERTDKNGYAQPVGKDRISAYVNGRVLPTEETLTKLCNVLDVSKEELLDDLEPANDEKKHAEQDQLVRITPHGNTTRIQFTIDIQPSDVFAAMNAFDLHVAQPYSISKIEEGNRERSPKATFVDLDDATVN